MAILTMKKCRTSRNKGVALVVVIAFSIAMAILAATTLILTSEHYRSTARQIKHTKAFYLTQAGLEWALYRCRTNPAPVFAADDINKPGGQLAPDRIEDPPGSSYYPPIIVTISGVQAGDPLGTAYHIDSVVDSNNVRVR